MKIFARTSLAVVAAALAGSLANAQDQKIEAVPADLAAAPPFKSALSNSTRVHVMVLMSGDPVAVVQRKLGRALSSTERAGVIASRRTEHAALRPLIEAHGGIVHAGLHSAIHGLRIEIAKRRLAEIARLPGVTGIKPVGTYYPVNATSVPLIAAPQVWQGVTGAQGQNVKIAIVDTGIDYTHANFGGPGTVAAFNTAKANSTGIANPALFGPLAPKVKGGIDLVGDAYDGSNSPVPDGNPLDCGGHGSHVAGTAAGFGVTSAGTTYSGAYNAAAYTPGAFRIGPGVAPKADLYAVRVFGCTGSTNVVADAIDWAVANGMDVISMSLGSNFGEADNSESVAVANARAAGILVVAASGNAGPTPYITSAPATSPGAISVAATDAMAGVPMANLALSTGATIAVQNSNGAAFVSPTTWPVVVLRNANGTVSLGCNPDEYDKTKNGGIDIAGKLVVTIRGTCARVFRAGAAQHFGAGASAMLNNAAGLPAYEGPIPGGAPTPNDGNIYEPVTIPFFGINGNDAPKFASAPTSPVAATATDAGIVANAGFEKVASFSSAGPRIGDSALRPGVTAPGVATVSTAVGSGNGFAVMSGTSMATPHVAGVAALVRQVNKTWSVDDQRAAIVQTASPSLMKDYSTRFEGSGLVQASAAVSTQAVVRLPDDSVGFGYHDLLADYSSTQQLTVHNNNTKLTQFNITVTQSVGPAGVTLTVPPSIMLPPNGDAQFALRLDVPAAAMGSTLDGAGNPIHADVGGFVKLTPASSRLNGGATLNVPFYFVGHSRSNLTASSAGGSAYDLSNVGGVVSATPDFYALGQIQPTPQGVDQADVRTIGARLTGSNVFFGINTHSRNSTALARQEFDICIDTSGNPGFSPSAVLIGINGSLLSSAASVQNVITTALFPTDSNCNITGGGTLLFTVKHPTDNSTFILPVSRSALGLVAGTKESFKYRLFYYGVDGAGAAMPGTGSFNAFNPPVTVTGGATLAPGNSNQVTVTVNPSNSTSPAKGVLVLARENVSGASQGLVLQLP